jgi:hypothetical protein
MLPVQSPSIFVAATVARALRERLSVGAFAFDVRNISVS